MPYIFRRYRLSKKRIHTADDANAGNMKTRVSSKTAFPIQKDGSGDMIYCASCRRKNGTAAPKIRSEDSFAAAQLKFEQGTISQNALLEAKDKVSAAQETVDGAEIDLFSAYNNYRWAVDRGILN